MKCNKAFFTFSLTTLFFCQFAFTQQIESIGLNPNTSFPSPPLLKERGMGGEADSTSVAKNRWFNEKSKGFYNNTTFSLSPFHGPLLNGMQTICGYKFNPHFALGGGIGLERFVNLATYDTLCANMSLMPLFAEVRYTVLRSKVSPVLAVQGGYKVLLNIPSSQVNYRFQSIYPGMAYNEFYDYDEYNHGGFFFSAEAGGRVKIYKRLNITLAAIYSLWSVSGLHHYWQYQYLLNTQINHWIERVFHYTDYTMAYTHVFLFRIGFGF